MTTSATVQPGRPRHLSRGQRVVATMVLAVAAFASMATSPTRWEVAHEASLPAAGLADGAALRYEIDVDMTGVVPDSNDRMGIDLTGVPREGTTTSLRATLRRNDGTPTSPVVTTIQFDSSLKSGVVWTTPWVDCKDAPCHASYVLVVERTDVASDGPHPPLALTGVVTASVRGIRKQPPGVTVRVAVRQLAPAP